MAKQAKHSAVNVKEQCYLQCFVKSLGKEESTSENKQRAALWMEEKQKEDGKGETTCPSGRTVCTGKVQSYVKTA